MPADPLAPPRPELLALLDSVKDHPDDDTPRLVLADWLDEQDNELDAERAKFIRDNIAAARGGAPKFYFHTEERDALAQRWLGSVAGLGIVNFVRGLPLLYPEGPRFLKPDVPALLGTEAFAFIQLVYFSKAGGPRMEAIAAKPEFRFVPGILLDPFSAFGADSAGRFFASPNLAGLRRIEFSGVKPGVVGIQALATNPALGGLRKLSLYHNKLVDKAIEALAETKHLTALTHLDLHDNNIGDKGGEALAASTAFPKLQCLDLRDNQRLTDRGKQLLRDTFGDRVQLD